MKVFSYWEGQKSEYIKVCIESMKRQCLDFTLITPQNAHEYLKDSGLSDKWMELHRPAHRADAIRVAIINKYGGFWVDCDTVFVRHFPGLVLHGCTFAYSRWDDGRCLNGYFYGAKGNPITAEWLEVINKKLHHIDCSNSWTSLGEKILTPLINSKKYEDHCCEMDRSVFLPINIDKIPWIFFEPVHWSSFITKDTVAVGLNHSWFCDFRMDFVESKTPWEGDCLINTLIRDAR